MLLCISNLEFQDRGSDGHILQQTLVVHYKQSQESGRWLPDQ